MSAGQRGRTGEGPAGHSDGREGERRTPAEDVGRIRLQIEALDRTLLEIVADRVELARRIGATKRHREAATLDPGREAAVIRRAVSTGRELGLPEEPVRQLFWTLVGLCRTAQLEER